VGVGEQPNHRETPSNSKKGHVCFDKEGVQGGRSIDQKILRKKGGLRERTTKKTSWGRALSGF